MKYTRQKIWGTEILTSDDLNGEFDEVQASVNQVDAEQINDNAIGQNHIQVAAVTSEKIADDAISTRHLQDGSVTLAKVAAGALTNVSQIRASYPPDTDAWDGTGYIHWFTAAQFDEVLMGIDIITGDDPGTFILTTEYVLHAAWDDNDTNSYSFFLSVIERDGVRIDGHRPGYETVDKIVSPNDGTRDGATRNYSLTTIIDSLAPNATTRLDLRVKGEVTNLQGQQRYPGFSHGIMTVLELRK